MNRYLKAVAVLFCLAWAVSGPVGAQDAFPSKTLRIVVPFGAGASANDIAARTLAQGLKDAMNWSVIVENKPGASGVIGMEYVKGSPPDGYTVSLFTNGFTILPALQSVPHRVEEDFEPIGIFMTVPFFLFAHQSVGVKDVQGLIEVAKANPNKLNYAIPGIGQPHHLAMELFMKLTDTRMFVIPYSSGIAAAIPDLIKGRVALMIGTLSSMAPHVKAGLVNVLGTTGPKRSTLLPESPPIGEAVPGYQVEVWTGFVAPKGTPKDVIGKLNAGFASAGPHIAERLRAAGMEGTSGTPEQMGAAVRGELQKWRKLVQDVGIKAQ